MSSAENVLLIDTSIFIDYLRGQPEAAKFLAGLQQKAPLQTHVVAVAETLAGAKNRADQNQIEQTFLKCRVEQIIPPDCDQSLTILKTFRLSHGIGWQDCLLAAAALRLQLPVATLNDKHFRMIPGLIVHRPY